MKLQCNLDLLEPEKLCWEGELTWFHRKPEIKLYKMIKVKRKHQGNKKEQKLQNQSTI